MFKKRKKHAKVTAKVFFMIQSCLLRNFAPVVVYTALIAFLARAAYGNLVVNHLNIKTAFINGN